MKQRKKMKEAIEEAAVFLKEKGFEEPTVGIILGTGLNKLVDEISIEAEMDYLHVPHFPDGTMEHQIGRLIYGNLEGKKVMVMQGRFHLYEGYTLQEITFPVRVMKELGCSTLLISNAAGAINPAFRKGSLMLIDDHINLQGGSPLAFKGAEELGERFVDMIEPYSKELMERLTALANEYNIPIYKGVYASVVGPQLETRAEYRMLKIIGADAVGMSSVPEIIVAKQLGLKTAAISVLTDECDPDNLEPINIPEILELARKAEPGLVRLYKNLVAQLH
jgi:purine-nucleoside phosphorylase